MAFRSDPGILKLLPVASNGRCRIVASLFCLFFMTAYIFLGTTISHITYYQHKYIILRPWNNNITENYSLTSQRQKPLTTVQLDANCRDTTVSSVNNSNEGKCNKEYRVTSQRQRHHLVEETCKRLYRDTSQNKTILEKLKFVLVDDSRQFLFCTPSKIGSSEWRATLITTSDMYKKYPKHELTHVDVHNNLEKYGIKRLLNYNDTEIQYRIEHYTKIILVRHPIKRAISSYKDKFVDKQLGLLTNADKTVTGTLRKIYRKDRRSKWIGLHTQIKLSDLVDYLEYQYKEDPFLIEQHWTPLQEVCQPCLINYDFIGKLETLDEDNPCIMDDVTQGKGGTIYEPGSHGPSSYKSKNGPNTQSLYSSYLANISQYQYEVLREIYRPDCDMFGYNCSTVD